MNSVYNRGRLDLLENWDDHLLLDLGDKFDGKY